MSLEQLESAKTLALQDMSLFPPIFDQILAIAQGQDIHLTRWCILFLRDCFCRDAIAFEVQMKHAHKTVNALAHCITVNDTVVVTSAIDIASTVYPIVFKNTIESPEYTEAWYKLGGLKSQIMDLMDTADPLLPLNRDDDRYRSIPVKVSCLKFYGKIIAVHLPYIRDPRMKLPDESREFSVAMVPPHHPVLWSTETDGEELLDRFFGVVETDIVQSTQIFTVFANVAVQLLRKRPKYVFSRLFNMILEFDAALQRPGVYETNMIKVKLMQRFNDRFNKILISFLLNRNFVKDANLKQKLDKKFKTLLDKQRAKIDQYSSVEPIPHLAKKYPGNVFYNTSPVPKDDSYKALYTLVQDTNQLAQFDVSNLPLPVLVDMITTSLTSIDTAALVTGLQVVSDRYKHGIDQTTAVVQQHQQQQQMQIQQEVKTLEDNESDYEPDFDDAEPYQLPPPKPLTESDKKEQMSRIVENFIKLNSEKKQLTNANTNEDDEKFENWLLIRLITRGLKDESLADVVRTSIFDHFTQDMKERIDIVISWLNEEWYNEHLNGLEGSYPNYTQWTYKILDNFLPFLEATDRKILIRFVSEIPLVDLEMVMKLKSLCSDPIRSKLGFQTLQYLIMFKPPAKQHCLTLLETMYEQSSEDIKEQCLTLLKKYNSEKYK